MIPLLPRKALGKLTLYINAPDAWKVVEVIMIAKHRKPPNEASSYIPIFLLPIVSKLFEKLP